MIEIIYFMTIIANWLQSPLSSLTTPRIETKICDFYSSKAADPTIQDTQFDACWMNQLINMKCYNMKY